MLSSADARLPRSGGSPGHGGLLYGAAWLALSLALAACAKDVKELLPFPCARDNTCPAPLACVPGVGCAVARLDALCSRDTDCGAAGAGARCALGACVVGCNEGQGCDFGRVCSTTRGAGSCVADCSTGAACPPGLGCQPLWYRGKKGCMPSAFAPTACAGFDTQSQCQFCGPTVARPIVCSGFTCYANSHCGTGRFCECDAGFTAVDCTGARCTGVNCAAGTPWWCRPDTDSRPTCTSVGPVTGTCRCTDGRAIPFACGSTLTCEVRCQSGCDTVKQDECTDPAAPKCTLRVVTAEGAATPGCVPLTGNRAVGQTCERASEGSEGVGHDTCAAGGFCNHLGVASSAPRLCRRFCRNDASCGGGQRCVPVSGLVPPDGTCSTACALFSTTCGTGLTCSYTDSNDGASGFGYCRALGAGRDGTPCADDTECGADMTCAYQDGCRANCDAAHPCPSGKTCEPYVLLPAAGLCR